MRQRVKFVIYAVVLALLIVAGVGIFYSGITSVSGFRRFDCVVEFKPDVTLVWGIWNWTIPCPDHSYCLQDQGNCRGAITPNTQTFCYCYRDGESLHIGYGNMSNFWLLMVFLSMIGTAVFIAGFISVAARLFCPSDADRSEDTRELVEVKTPGA